MRSSSILTGRRMHIRIRNCELQSKRNFFFFFFLAGKYIWQDMLLTTVFQTSGLKAILQKSMHLPKLLGYKPSRACPKTARCFASQHATYVKTSASHNIFSENWFKGNTSSHCGIRRDEIATSFLLVSSNHKHRTASPVLARILWGRQMVISKSAAFINQAHCTRSLHSCAFIVFRYFSDFRVLCYSYFPTPLTKPFNKPINQGEEITL